MLDQLLRELEKLRIRRVIAIKEPEVSGFACEDIAELPEIAGRVLLVACLRNCLGRHHQKNPWVRSLFYGYYFQYELGSGCRGFATCVLR